MKEPRSFVAGIPNKANIGKGVGGTVAADLGDHCIITPKAADGLLRFAVNPGAHAGTVALPGVAPGGKLVMVLLYRRTGPPGQQGFFDLTAEFAVSGPGQIENAGGTSSTPQDQMLILYREAV